MKEPGCLGYIGDYTTEFCVGYNTVDNYKDPYQTTSMMKSKSFFFRGSVGTLLTRHQYCQNAEEMWQSFWHVRHREPNCRLEFAQESRKKTGLGMIRFCLIFVGNVRFLAAHQKPN